MKDDDLLDLTTLSGRIAACWIAGFLVAAFPVFWTLITDSGPTNAAHVDTRTTLEAWGLVLGASVAAIGSIAVAVHWIFVHEPTRPYRSYYDEQWRDIN